MGLHRRSRSRSRRRSRKRKRSKSRNYRTMGIRGFMSNRDLASLISAYAPATQHGMSSDRLRKGKRALSRVPNPFRDKRRKLLDRIKGLRLYYERQIKHMSQNRISRNKFRKKINMNLSILADEVKKIRMRSHRLTPRRKYLKMRSLSQKLDQMIRLADANDVDMEKVYSKYPRSPSY